MYSERFRCENDGLIEGELVTEGMLQRHTARRDERRNNLIHGWEWRKVKVDWVVRTRVMDRKLKKL